ncbi:hypothetical protein A2U01_0055836, partial [Trifolium medium]|nr:hypothetical protein [Trifolium medium]
IMVRQTITLLLPSVLAAEAEPEAVIEQAEEVVIETEANDGKQAEEV